MALQDYYDSKLVSSGRKDYYCDCCGELIPKGTPSQVHSFYPFDSSGCRTHTKCSKKFLNGHSCNCCGEWIENGTQKIHDGKTLCPDCYNEVKEN